MAHRPGGMRGAGEFGGDLQIAVYHGEHQVRRVQHDEDPHLTGIIRQCRRQRKIDVPSNAADVSAGPGALATA